MKSKNQSKKLSARIAAWAKTVDDLNSRKQNSKGFHCPGSNKK